MDRRRQITLLLGSLFDFTLEPENFTAKVVRRGSMNGKGSPSHWQPCPRCDGSGATRSYGKLVPCDVCKGTGRRRIDDYTNEVVVTDEARDVSLGELIRRDTKHVRCPDCQDLAGNATGVVHGRPCGRCSGTGEAPVAGSWLSVSLKELADDGKEKPASGDAIDALLNAIERRNLLGSYPEIEKARAGIIHHVNKPLRFEALTINAVDAVRVVDEVWVFKTRTEQDLTRFEAALLELALDYIDTRMPDPIRVPRDVVRNAEERAKAPKAKGQALTVVARQRRDAEIRKQVLLKGLGVQYVAQQHGLSPAQVNRICAVKPQREQVA